MSEVLNRSCRLDRSLERGRRLLEGYLNGQLFLGIHILPIVFNVDNFAGESDDGTFNFNEFGFELSLPHFE